MRQGARWSDASVRSGPGQILRLERNGTYLLQDRETGSEDNDEC